MPSQGQQLIQKLPECNYLFVIRCSDPEVTKLVTLTASKIDKLTAKLVDCAKAVATAPTTSEHAAAVEQFTVMKHNWKSNVSHPL